MRIFLSCCAVAIAAFVGVAVSQNASAPAHVLTTASEIKWGEPPPVFEKGASFAVVAGDPKTDSTVQVHGMGPFALTYVNPADDPSKRAAVK